MDRWGSDSEDKEQTTTDGLFSFHKSLKHIAFLEHCTVVYYSHVIQNTHFVFIELDHLMFYFWIEMSWDSLFLLLSALHTAAGETHL